MSTLHHTDCPGSAQPPAASLLPPTLSPALSLPTLTPALNADAHAHPLQLCVRSISPPPPIASINQPRRGPGPGTPSFQTPIGTACFPPPYLTPLLTTRAPNSLLTSHCARPTLSHPPPPPPPTRTRTCRCYSKWALRLFNPCPDVESRFLEAFHHPSTQTYPIFPVSHYLHRSYLPAVPASLGMCRNGQAGRACILGCLVFCCLAAC